MGVKLTDEQLADAMAIARYMTLSTIESEIQDCLDLKGTDDSYDGVAEVIAVLQAAAYFLENGELPR